MKKKPPHRTGPTRREMGQEYRELRGWEPKRRPKRKPCRWCGKSFKVKPQGRRPAYCSPSCRQRAYEVRRFEEERPRAIARLVQADADQMFGREGIKRAVVDVLRELDILPPAPGKPSRRGPSLRVVEPDDPEDEGPAPA